MPTARGTTSRSPRARTGSSKSTAAVPRQRAAAEPNSAPAKLPPPQPDGPNEGITAQRWRSRPMAARAIQLLVLAVPIAASVVCAAFISAVFAKPHGLGPQLGWWAIVVVTSTIALVIVDRAARRLLPLALLLRLSLLFPDQAPKRFRVAARAWNTRRLNNELEAVRASGERVAPVEAAAHIIGLLGSLAAHDRRTRGHCERVRAYNDLLAEELGLSPEDRDRLRWAALIHDIGKLKVPRRLLNKAGTPTAREWELLRAHPKRGAEIAAPLADWLGPWADSIAQHHEHWDGSGYPHGLSGEDISLGARIVGVADAFEVMTSPRPYSRPVSPDAARAELAACAGTHFDPVVVRAFLNISLGRLRKAMGPVAWFAQVPFLASAPQLSAALIQGGQQAAVASGSAIGVLAATSLPATHHGHSHDAAATPHPAASQSQAAGGAGTQSNVLPPVVGALSNPHPSPTPGDVRSGHRADAAVQAQSAKGNSGGDGNTTAPGQVAEHPTAKSDEHRQNTTTTKSGHGKKKGAQRHARRHPHATTATAPLTCLTGNGNDSTKGASTTATTQANGQASIRLCD